MGDLKLITTAYDGKCRKCRAGIRKGERVWWQKGTKGVLCIDCKADTAPVPSPAPITTSEPTTRVSSAHVPKGNYRTEVQGKRIVRIWDSWDAFVESSVLSANPHEFSHDSGMTEWSGFSSYDDAVKVAREGWAEIRPEIDALVEQIEKSVTPSLQPAFTNYFDVSGGMVDVGRFLDGEPECMVETRLVEIARPGKVITILAQGFYSSSIAEEDIKARGAAIVAFVDSVERMQHSTEIYVEYTYSDQITHVVNVKSADDALDIDKLMFVLAHRSAYRRISFGVQEGEANELGCGESGQYGHPNELSQGDKLGASVKLESLDHNTRLAFGKEWVKARMIDVGLVKEGE